MNGRNCTLYNALTKLHFTKGDGFLRQVILSLVIVFLAAGVLAGMVLYTLWMIRAEEIKLLLGMLSGVSTW